MRRALLALVVLVASLVVPVAGVGAAGAELDPAMVALWERTDGPVAAGETDRSWLWGPQANRVTTEPYTYAPLKENRRLVAYFDKSRMEINDPSGDPSDPWYITNGRLVYEMMTGRIQVGQDPDIYTTVLPASIPVAGDPFSWNTPTYQVLGRLMGSAPDRTGEIITATVDRDGTTGFDLSRRAAGLRYGAYVTYTGEQGETVGHNLPEVFVDFLTRHVSPLVAPADWVFVTGYPLTEPYWTKTLLNGQETDVLVQCFERRCLTYTPSNPDPFKVEMGNVGLHYQHWRYGSWQVSCPTVPVRGFGTLWSSNREVRDTLGCPEDTTGERGIRTAYQRFERGTMIWVDVDDVYNPERSILVLYDDGTFARYADTWDEGQAVSDPRLTPPAGLYQPVRGFGKVWRDVPGVRDRLGWAVEPERGSHGAYQRFNYGTMVWIEDFDQIWVFAGDLYWNPGGTWSVHDDTFDG
ncbi:hypothetical protein [Sphaerobacter thermophilus]|uniref:hypothetical protein n=1 Tax=Sphaerobacter thermophilus TaxID=2057 RepID=UPI000DB7B5C3|nr:MAG: hypothetical protein DIU58_14100 [Sphaerobacter thermophilus]